MANTTINPNHRLQIKLFPKSGWQALISLSVAMVFYLIFFFYLFINYWEYVSSYGQIAAIYKFGLFLVLGIISLFLICLYIFILWNRSKYALYINKNGFYIRKNKTIFIPWEQVESLSIKKLDKYFMIFRVSQNWLLELNHGINRKLLLIEKRQLHPAGVNRILEMYESSKEKNNYSIE